jgi:hypothetical protein
VLGVAAVVAAPDFYPNYVLVPIIAALPLALGATTRHQEPGQDEEHRDSDITRHGRSP